MSPVFVHPFRLVLLLFQLVSRFGEFLEFLYVASYFHGVKDLHHRFSIRRVLDFLLLL
jgi:hypothetical protein